MKSATPSVTFMATLPVKPSVTMTSALVLVDLAALDVADEVDAGDGAQAGVYLLHHLVALVVLTADVEEGDARLRDAEHVLGVDAAHLRELDEVAGLHVGVGADVEDEDAALGEGGDGAEGGALDAVDALQVSSGRRP